MSSDSNNNYQPQIWHTRGVCFVCDADLPLHTMVYVPGKPNARVLICKDCWEMWLSVRHVFDLVIGKKEEA